MIFVADAFSGWSASFAPLSHGAFTFFESAIKASIVLSSSCLSARSCSDDKEFPRF